MPEITIAIQIGNSDDKLTQKEWAEYVEQCRMLIRRFSSVIYFFGASSNWEEWQNAAWIFSCEMHYALILKENLTSICQHYKQDSIAWSECKTEFI